MTPIQTNKPLFFNLAGDPLNGEIYIGQPNTDPRTSPKTVTFRDAGGAEFTAQQPLTTLNGRIIYNGKPIVALVDGEYSLLSFDSAGVQVDYERSIVPAGAGGGGVANFSEVTRVGLTLDEVKAFDVAVGDVVQNVGRVILSDGLGAQWVVKSSTGSPGDDVDLIDFANGLQGERVMNVVYAYDISSDIAGGLFKPEAPRSVWTGSATSVLYTDMSEQGAGWYILRTSSYELSIYVSALPTTKTTAGSVYVFGAFDYCPIIFGNSFIVRETARDSPYAATNLPIVEILKV